MGLILCAASEGSAGKTAEYQDAGTGVDDRSKTGERRGEQRFGHGAILSERRPV